MVVFAGWSVASELFRSGYGSGLTFLELVYAAMIGVGGIMWLLLAEALSILAFDGRA